MAWGRRTMAECRGCRAGCLPERTGGRLYCFRCWHLRSCDRCRKELPGPLSHGRMCDDCRPPGLPPRRQSRAGGLRLEVRRLAEAADREARIAEYIARADRGLSLFGKVWEEVPS